ncbi:chemotaxis protein CheW [Natrialbaceae archaeon A-arb3/5]
MAPDLPEKLLGIDIDDVDGTQQRETADSDEAEELVRFVLIGIGEHRLAVPVDDVRTITDVPDDRTRIPRTPQAVTGVTDLRGEITAVIDPTVYFPTTEDRPGREQLLVFDVPADEQSAAIRIDDVLSVDAVPERNVLDGAALDSQDVDGSALEHPLVGALIERERTQTKRREAIDMIEPALGTSEASAPTADGTSVTETTDREPTAEIVDEAATTPSVDQSTAGQQVVEILPLIDVETLLLASDHRAIHE